MPVKLIYTLIRTHPFSILRSHAFSPRLFGIVRLHAAGRNRHDRRARTASGAALRAAAAAGRPAGTDDRHSRAAILSARHAAEHDQHRIGPPGDRSQRHRSAVFRRAHPRLGLPRFSRAGHRLPRASRPRPAERGDDLRRLERLPRPAQRHRASRQHDRAGADSRRRGRRHRVWPRAGRKHDRAAQRRHIAHARIGERFHRLAHDRLGERRDRAVRRGAEPNRQPPDDRGCLLRHQPARALPEPRA